MSKTAQAKTAQPAPRTINLNHQTFDVMMKLRMLAGLFENFEAEGTLSESAALGLCIGLAECADQLDTVLQLLPDLKVPDTRKDAEAVN